MRASSDRRDGTLAHLGARLVRPAHRNLGDGPVGAVEVLQHLHVDPPAVEPGRGERGPGPVPVEEFETALGVADAGHREQPYEDVAGAAQQFPQPVLAAADRGARHAA